MEKLGFKSWKEDCFDSPVKWWWKPLWKFKAPLRREITLSLALNNKLLTWDNGLKRGWCGPIRCALCKLDAETTSHLFVSCPYARQATKIIKEKTNAKAG
jgi:hypothetical protein